MRDLCQIPHKDRRLKAKGGRRKGSSNRESKQNSAEPLESHCKGFDENADLDERLTAGCRIDGEVGGGVG